jgi:hypothetical protein
MQCPDAFGVEGEEGIDGVEGEDWDGLTQAGLTQTILPFLLNHCTALNIPIAKVPHPEEGYPLHYYLESAVREGVPGALPVIKAFVNNYPDALLMRHSFAPLSCTPHSPHCSGITPYDFIRYSTLDSDDSDFYSDQFIHQLVAVENYLKGAMRRAEGCCQWRNMCMCINRAIDEREREREREREHEHEHERTDAASRTQPKTTQLEYATSVVVELKERGMHGFVDQVCDFAFGPCKDLLGPVKTCKK